MPVYPGAPVFVLSPTGIVSTWNEGAERIKGYRAEQIVGEHFSIFYSPADREAGVPDENLRQAVTEGRSATEGWRVRSDGSPFWASVLITPVWDGIGRLRGFAKLTRDDTERLAVARAHDAVTRIPEQKRIALSLADNVIRRLFGLGLVFASALGLVSEEDLRVKLTKAVQETDEIINDLRSIVYDLSEVASPGPRTE